jgi:pimeloyl-ACP methyl ester carboxylesterase
MLTGHKFWGAETMRHDIEFRTTDGVTLRGWCYVPSGSGKHPTIVMSHGLSAVKEMYLDCYAEEFTKAGLACVVYDNRNFGASDGEPRLELDPWLQTRDYSDAITFAQTLDQADPERIGIWGSSYSGGHVLIVAATDSRVKCVVSQVPLIDGPASLRPRFGPELLKRFHADRIDRAAGQPPRMMAVVTQDPSVAAMSRKEDSYRWFTNTGATRAPAWQNGITLRSMEYAAGYLPGAYTPYISPTPFLLILAKDDSLPMDIAVTAFERAGEPKKLIVLPCGHYDVYTDMFDQSAGPARDWFAAHIG